MSVTVTETATLVEVTSPGPQGPPGPGGTGSYDFEYHADPLWLPSGANTAGALRLRGDGTLFLCSVSGTPGQWWEITGWTQVILEAWLSGALGGSMLGGTGFGGIGG